MAIDSNTFSIAPLRQQYLEGRWHIRSLLAEIQQRCDATANHNAWIYRLSPAELEPYVRRLESESIESLPLYGIPFAIKDNLDLAGVPTTAACAEFSYIAERHAAVVQRLIDLGAVPIGKTNMDQFATGLNGTRSPYGIAKNAINPDYISGGSSSGSALAVALNLVSFALGTDTAGSGRVPAAMNNIFGFKPTKGLLSTRGLVPACRSLDVVNVFSHNLEDGAQVIDHLSVFDTHDAFARKKPGMHEPDAINERLVIGVPRFSQLEFFGDDQCEARFLQSVEHCQAQGAEVKEIDFTPFIDAANLLYAGPWLAERQIACAVPLAKYPEAIDSTVRTVLQSAQHSAAETFQAFYQLAALKRAADMEMARVNCVLTPTCGAQYTIAQMLAEPVVRNTELGYYTNYMNLLDYCALAVPFGFTLRGIPFGVTLVAPAFEDQRLNVIARRLFVQN